MCVIWYFKSCQILFPVIIEVVALVQLIDKLIFIYKHIHRSRHIFLLWRGLYRNIWITASPQFLWYNQSMLLLISDQHLYLIQKIQSNRQILFQLRSSVINLLIVAITQLRYNKQLLFLFNTEVILMIIYCQFQSLIQIPNVCSKLDITPQNLIIPKSQWHRLQISSSSSSGPASVTL